MRAARFHGAGDIRIEEIAEPPAPGPGELLLRVVAAGICGSDALEYRSGPVLAQPPGEEHPVTGHLGPLTLGHEFAATVVSAGPGAGSFAVGTLVACGAGMSCGDCARCAAGRTNLCERYATVGFHRDGGLAQFCVVPADICVDAGPYGLTADAVALAQPMAIAVHAARRGRVAAGETAVVVGAGGIGTFLAFAASAYGAEVVVADLDEARLEVARALGAARTIAVGDGRELDRSLAADGVAADVIFEVSGSATGCEQALRAAPRGGRVVLVGVQKAPPTLDLARITLDELELLGTVAHVCREDLPEALRLIALREGGWTDVAPEAVPLERLVDDGLRPLAEGSSPRIKTLVDPWAKGPRPSATAPG